MSIPGHDSTFRVVLRVLYPGVVDCHRNDVRSSSCRRLFGAIQMSGFDYVDEDVCFWWIRWQYDDALVAILLCNVGFVVALVRVQGDGNQGEENEIIMWFWTIFVSHRLIIVLYNLVLKTDWYFNFYIRF